MAKQTTKTKSPAKKVAAKKTAKPKAVKAVAKKKAVVKKAIKKTDKTEVKAVKNKKTPIKKVTKKTATSGKVRIIAPKTSGKTKTGRKVEVIVTPVQTKPKKKINGYTKKELEEFRSVILEKRTEIIEQLQNLKEQMMDETTGQYVNENSPYSLHMAEQGTDAQEREKLYLWAQRETKFLGYLEDALQRIDHGTYGICIDSIDLPEGPHLIPKNRLFAVPHTQHCVACKNKK